MSRLIEVSARVCHKARLTARRHSPDRIACDVFQLFVDQGVKLDGEDQSWHQIDVQVTARRIAVTFTLCDSADDVDKETAISAIDTLLQNEVKWAGLKEEEFEMLHRIRLLRSPAIPRPTQAPTLQSAAHPALQLTAA